MASIGNFHIDLGSSFGEGHTDPFIQDEYVHQKKSKSSTNISETSSQLKS